MSDLKTKWILAYWKEEKKWAEFERKSNQTEMRIILGGMVLGLVALGLQLLWIVLE